MSPSHQQIYTLTLRSVFNYMRERGVDTADLLVGTELTPADIEEPYHLMNEDQARAFYRNVIDHADQDGIGLEVGWVSGLSDMGPHGMIQAAARTVREAMHEGLDNQHFYYLLGNWQVRIERNILIHSMSGEESDAALHRFMIERGMAILQAHAEELCGTDVKPLRLLLDYPKPSNHRRYQEIFACPVLFSQPGCELHHPAEILDREVKTYDPQVKEVLSSLRENLQGKLASRGDIIRDVKLNLRRDSGHFPSLEQVASSLAMSSRTLRRRLRDKNTSFQELLDAERHQVAVQFLLDTTMNIQQIAEYCGFNDAQNFSQAFKRWQGISPTEFRSSQLE